MITAVDLCRRDGCKTHREWILRLSENLRKKNQLDTPFTGEITEKNPVYAEVDWGRWIARCECNGAEYVSKEEKIFYCFSCGNYKYGGKGRKVIFPKVGNMKQIEEILDEREMVQGTGTEKISRVLHSKPKVFGLSRTWRKDESIADLKKQNKDAKLAYKREVKNGI